jgi:hypothetical protein
MTQKSARVWNGTEWVEISNTLVSPNAIAAYQNSAPSSPFTGQIWVDADSTINIIDANDYLSKVDATSIYLSQSSASSTYLTQVNASAIYAKISSPGLTGTPTAPTASVGTDNTQIATTAFVYDQAPLFSNRNLLYNGSMQVHQRVAAGVAVNSISNYASYITADRWYTEVPYLQSYGTIEQSIQNDAPAGSGFRKSLKHLYTGADAISGSKYLWISQKLEGQDVQRLRKGTASAQQLTLSFWVKSNLPGTYIAELVDVDNTRYVSQAYTVSASGTWEFKTVTFPADTTGVLDNDNSESLRLNFWLRGGSTYSGGASLQTTWGTTTNTRAVGQVNLSDSANNYWQITGVQLEIGPNPTPFEFKSYVNELRECQRYYWRTTKVSTSTGDVTGPFCMVSCSSNAAQGFIQFPVTMRSAPTSISNSAASTFSVHVQGVLNNQASSLSYSSTQDSMKLNIIFTYASTAGFAGQLCAYNATAFIEASAEL